MKPGNSPCGSCRCSIHAPPHTWLPACCPLWATTRSTANFLGSGAVPTFSPSSYHRSSDPKRPLYGYAINILTSGLIPCPCLHVWQRALRQVHRLLQLLAYELRAIVETIQSTFLLEPVIIILLITWIVSHTGSC